MNKPLNEMNRDEIYQYNKHNPTGDCYKNAVNSIVKRAMIENKPVHVSLIYSGIGYNPHQLHYNDMMNNGYEIIDNFYVKRG